MLRGWFLRPIINLAIISSRQDAVELLVKAPDVCTTLRSHLSKVHFCPDGTGPNLQSFCLTFAARTDVVSLDVCRSTY